MRTKFYNYGVAGFRFRIAQIGAGRWRAKVYVFGRWRSVAWNYDQRVPIEFSTKRAAQEHLDYAYEGKESVKP